MQDQDSTKIPSLKTDSLGILGGGGLGLNFNVPDFSNNNHNDDEEEHGHQKFSWKYEIESIDPQMVKLRCLNEDIDQHNCTARLETLEGEYFDLTCSVAKGIRVVETNRPDFDDKKAFESIESLLMKVSPMYIKAFTLGNC